MLCMNEEEKGTPGLEGCFIERILLFVDIWSKVNAPYDIFKCCMVNILVPTYIGQILNIKFCRYFLLV